MYSPEWWYKACTRCASKSPKSFELIVETNVLTRREPLQKTVLNKQYLSMLRNH